MQGRQVQFQLRKYRIDTSSPYYANYPNYAFVETGDPPVVFAGFLMPDKAGQDFTKNGTGNQSHHYEWTHQLIVPASADVRGGQFGTNSRLAIVRIIPNEVTGAAAVAYPPPGVVAFADFYVEWVERYGNAFKRAYVRRVGRNTYPSDVNPNDPGNPGNAPGDWIIQ